MQVATAEARLREMLAAAGIDTTTASAGPVNKAPTAWDVYKAFTAEPVDEAADDPDHDMLAFNHSLAETDGGQQVFSLYLTRQFILNDSRGEYDHMEQLDCAIFCDLTPELEQIEREDGVFLPTATHRHEWISDVENSAGFAALQQQPINVAIYQGHV